jgi:hypothetical protein
LVKEVVVRWPQACLYFPRQPHLATILYRVRLISADSGTQPKDKGQCADC